MDLVGEEFENSGINQCDLTPPYVLHHVCTAPSKSLQTKEQNLICHESIGHSELSDNRTSPVPGLHFSD
jgi:hypothetical protein